MIQTLWHQGIKSLLTIVDIVFNTETRLNIMVGMLAQVEKSFNTLPAWFAGGLDADLDQYVLRGTVLPTVVSGHSQLVHAFFAIA